MKKNLFASLVVAAVVALGLGSAAQAVQIDGDISFAGSYTVDNTANLSLATKFNSFSGVTVVAGETAGSYAGTDGAPVTFTTFAFADSSVTPLWTFTIGATTFSFDATTVVKSFANTNNLVVEGEGVAHITGFDDTPGFWNITANKARTSFSFSSSSAAVPVVPEPASLAVAGLGLATILLRRRKA